MMALRLFALAAAVILSAGSAFAEAVVSFRHDVVPILTKNGCNGGGCHGKLDGQNGFRLSLLGFEPAEDHAHIVIEQRGRRVMRGAPRHSLLLQKATGEIPHGGGVRMERGAADYETIVRWIEQGMAPLRADEPLVTGIEVTPPQLVTERGAEQKLKVIAKLNDGSTRDVTALACYESNLPDMATVAADGAVRMGQTPGDAAVMIRFQEHVAVFRATIPLGAPVANLPPERNFIDTHVFAKLRTLGLPPSAVCDDATFLRRVTLDLAGRIPSVEEAAAFLADQAPDKRDRAIERLLASDDYADAFANKWTALLRNKRKEGPTARGTVGFHAWVRENIRSGRPYREWVADLLTASGSITANPAVSWYRAVTDQKEQLQDVAQMFLGTRLQCAQCHHHPFEKWSQEDYYGFAAFFSTIGRKKGAEPFEDIVFHQTREATAQNIRTNKPVKPTVLGGQPLAIPADEDPRAALATWLTAADNPFFARMAVNRYWKHFFGRGLVEPEDDLRVTNPPSNPELMAALEKHFTESGTDLRALCRAICQSTTYQLAALPNEHNAKDAQNFSRYYPRRMQAETLLDAIDTVTGVASKFPGMPAGTPALALPDDSFNSGNYFLTVFGRPDNASACECERVNAGSLAQRLHMLNAKPIQEKLAKPEGRTASLAKGTAPLPEKLRDLYMAAVARPPTEGEVKIAGDFLAKKAGKEQEAWEDIVWALLNTKEFLFNR